MHGRPPLNGRSLLLYLTASNWGSILWLLRDRWPSFGSKQAPQTRHTKATIASRFRGQGLRVACRFFAEAANGLGTLDRLDTNALRGSPWGAGASPTTRSNHWPFAFGLPLQLLHMPDRASPSPNPCPRGEPCLSLNAESKHTSLQRIQESLTDMQSHAMVHGSCMQPPPGCMSIMLSVGHPFQLDCPNRKASRCRQMTPSRYGERASGTQGWSRSAVRLCSHLCARFVSALWKTTSSLNRPYLCAGLNLRPGGVLAPMHCVMPPHTANSAESV